MTEQARRYAEAIFATIGYPLLMLGKNLRVMSASEIFYKIFKVNEKETIGNLLYRLGNGQWGIPDLRKNMKIRLLKRKNIKVLKLNTNLYILVKNA